MSLKIISADERMEQAGVRAQIWGPAKIGKTSLAWTLPPKSTLFLDLEAGMLALQGWGGDSIQVRSWDQARDLAAFIGGPNPALRPEQPYSHAHFDHVCKQYGDRAMLDKYDTLFVDSTTVAAQLCLTWAQGQPEAFSERSGKPDLRGAYGALGRELVAWAWQLHHAPIRNVFLIGGLEERKDDFGRSQWLPLIDGSRATNALPYVFDVIMTMAELETEQGERYRALVCDRLNPWGYPAGDRSGRLDTVEPPDLGALIKKVRGTKKPFDRHLTTTIPQPTTTEPEAAE